MTVQDAVPALRHCAGHWQCNVVSLPLGLQVAVRNAQQGVFYFTDQVGLGHRVAPTHVESYSAGAAIAVTSHLLKLPPLFLLTGAWEAGCPQLS